MGNGLDNGWGKGDPTGVHDLFGCSVLTVAVTGWLGLDASIERAEGSLSLGHIAWLRHTQAFRQTDRDRQTCARTRGKSRKRASEREAREREKQQREAREREKQQGEARARKTSKAKEASERSKESKAKEREAIAYLHVEQALATLVRHLEDGCGRQAPHTAAASPVKTSFIEHSVEPAPRHAFVRDVLPVQASHSKLSRSSRPGCGGRGKGGKGRGGREECKR